MVEKGDETVGMDWVVYTMDGNDAKHDGDWVVVWYGIDDNMVGCCMDGEMDGEDAWQRHCIESGFMQCNYNALPPSSTVQPDFSSFAHLQFLIFSPVSFFASWLNFLPDLLSNILPSSPTI